MADDRCESRNRSSDSCQCILKSHGHGDHKCKHDYVWRNQNDPPSGS